MKELLFLLDQYVHSEKKETYKKDQKQAINEVKIDRRVYNRTRFLLICCMGHTIFL
jgi:hypothetical protein